MRNHIIVRLVTFYLAVLVVVAGSLSAFPVLGEHLAAERARQGARASLEGGPPAVPAPPASLGPWDLLDVERSIPVLLSLFTATLVTLPVAWVYQWTRPRRRYHQTFAHTLLVVPIAITLVVFLVKGSLALAFSLAGIVAAVRFRTTLDEPLDAVFLFLVIGIGLAAGVQLLFVAFLASMVFNAVVLAVWRANVGGQAVVVRGWRAVPEGPVPSPGPGPVAVPAEAAEEEPERFNTRVRLHVRDADAARPFADRFMDDRAKRWQLAEISSEADGTPVIEYDLRLKKSVDLAAFIREIEQGPHVIRVELTKTKARSTASYTS